MVHPANTSYQDECHDKCEHHTIYDYIHCNFLSFLNRIYMVLQIICRILNYKHESWIKSHTFPYFLFFPCEMIYKFLLLCTGNEMSQIRWRTLWWPFPYSCIMKALAEGQPNDCSEDILYGTPHDMGIWSANTFLALLSIQQWWSILVLCQKCTVNNTPMYWKTWSLKNSFAKMAFLLAAYGNIFWKCSIIILEHIIYTHAS